VQAAWVAESLRQWHHLQDPCHSALGHQQSQDPPSQRRREGDAQGTEQSRAAGLCDPWMPVHLSVPCCTTPSQEEEC